MCKCLWKQVAKQQFAMCRWISEKFSLRYSEEAITHDPGQSRAKNTVLSKLRHISSEVLFDCQVCGECYKLCGSHRFKIITTQMGGKSLKFMREWEYWEYFHLFIDAICLGIFISIKFGSKCALIFYSISIKWKHVKFPPKYTHYTSFVCKKKIIEQWKFAFLSSIHFFNVFCTNEKYNFALILHKNQVNQK